MKGRIYFENNPWPEGHPIKKLDLSCDLAQTGIGLNLHLETEDYYSERDIQTYDDNDQSLPEFENISDWQHPDVWGNYHACTMSNTYWNDLHGPNLSRPGKLFEVKDLADAPVLVDTLRRLDDGTRAPILDLDHDEQAFHIYLLGHDAVADHRIDFSLQENGLLSLNWTGLIANAYVGDYNFKHKFRAEIEDIEFQGFRYRGTPQETLLTNIGATPKSTEVPCRALARKWIKNTDAFSFEPRRQHHQPDWLRPLL